MSSSSQDISLNFCNPKVHYRVHNSSSFVFRDSVMSIYLERYNQMMCARFISLKIRSNGGLCVYENEHLTFRKRWEIFLLKLREG
jgi:hypothetical protein